MNVSLGEGRPEMTEAIRELQRRIGLLQRVLGRIHTRHLNVVETRDDIRSLVQYYFGQFRRAYVSDRRFETNLADVDSSMQDLLRYAQRRTLVSVYRRTLKNLSNALHELELKSVVLSTPERMSIVSNTRHGRILETLAKTNPSSAVSYEQALLDLGDPGRKSWRGTAVEFRESLRELLDSMAPDDDVKAQAGFKLVPDTRGPTMRQKAAFILKSRRLSRTQSKPPLEAIDILENLIGGLVRSVYDRSSTATHTVTNRNEVLKIRDYVTLVFTELLEVSL